VCGRFAFYSPREAVQDFFGNAGLHFHGDYTVPPSYNIAPSRQIVAVSGWTEPEFREFKWGLVPSWSKDPAVGNRMINARAETLREKPSFRSAIKKRRCLILADGYYEWQSTDSGKQPYFFAARDRTPLLLAGLWEHWDKGDEPLQTATIITTEASDSVAKVHHRMPVILDAVSARLWLDYHSDDATVDRLLKTRSDVIFWPVDKRVNSPGNNDASLPDPMT